MRAVQNLIVCWPGDLGSFHDDSLRLSPRALLQFFGAPIEKVGWADALIGTNMHWLAERCNILASPCDPVKADEGV